MALRLNLHHEIEQKQRVKSRDPMKVVILALICAGGLLAGYYALRLGSTSATTHELEAKTAEFSALSPKADAAKERENELIATIKASDAIVRRIEDRFYWAPMLEQVARLVPPQIQITRLSGEVEGNAVKKCVLKMDGIAAGKEARKVAEEMRMAMQEEFSKRYKDVTSSFTTLEDKNETVKLNGSDAPTAAFAISVKLATGVEVVATPAPTRRKR